MDAEWDMKSFAFLDPTGKNSMNQERKVKLTNLQFIEHQQLSSRINMSVQRGSKRRKAEGGYEYGLNDAFQIFDTISNSIR